MILVTGAGGFVGGYLVEAFNGAVTVTTSGLDLSLPYVMVKQSIFEKSNYVIPKTIIHLALARNITKDIITFAKEYNCHLIYMSSWVVAFKGIQDWYVKFKRQSELKIMKSELSYVILRPSLIIGNGSIWNRILSFPLIRSLPITVSVVHVNEVIDIIKESLYKSNKIIPVYGSSYRVNELFSNGSWLWSAISLLTLLPLLLILSLFASFGFIWNSSDKNISVRTKCYMWKDSLIATPSIIELSQLMRLYPTQCQGIGNESTLDCSFGGAQLHRKAGVIYVRLNAFNQIAIKDGKAVVGANVTLTDLGVELEKHGLTLGTFPEYTNVTAGACIATPVHGSTGHYSHVACLVSNIRVWFLGTEHYLTRNDPLFKLLVFNRDLNYVVTEVTFDTIPDVQTTKETTLHYGSLTSEFVIQQLASAQSVTMHQHFGSPLLIWKCYATSNRFHHPSWFMIRRYHPFLRLLYPKKVTGTYRQIVGSWTRLNWIEKSVSYCCNTTFLRPTITEIFVSFDDLNKVLQYLKIHQLSFGLRLAGSNHHHFDNDPVGGSPKICVDISTNHHAEFLSKFRSHIGKNYLQ
jgi:hypothetical protein